ncbi:MAG: winged helix-turn-helix domain-containing protein [Nitrososphaera sp.]|jgi:predicted transcriptional regulator
MPLTNRSREEIIAAILQVVSGPPTRSTFIIYRAAISYFQFKQYAQMAKSRELIARTADGRWFITDKGREYLEAYRGLMKVLNEEKRREQYGPT